jgi:glutamate-1-semialdehyde 2,1-aminomutase
MPRPTRDDFVPYGGELDQLDGPRDAQLVQTFRRGMLLHGVDLPGLSGMTTAAHREADVDQTVAAVAATLELLREEGLS